MRTIYIDNPNDVTIIINDDCNIEILNEKGEWNENDLY